MKRRHAIAMICLLLASQQSYSAHEFAKIAWPQGKSAVAWQTKKTMFLVNSQQPVGISASVDAQIAKQGEDRKIKIIIPIKSFDSGEPDRDAEVIKILKGDIQRDLEFVSEALTTMEWSDLEKGGKGKIGGQLKIGGKSFPLAFLTETTAPGPEQSITGFTSAKYSDFDLEPPSVAGGLIAKVDDVLILHFRIFSKDVRGL